MGIKINLGCGYDIREGYLNLDFEDIKGHDEVIKIDMLKRETIPVKDGEASHILMKHVIEHFFEEDVKTILKMCYNLLEVGGTLELYTPDFNLMVNAWKSGELNIQYISRLMYGWAAHYETRPKEMYMLHKIMFDRATMRQFLEDAGFSRIVPGVQTGYPMLEQYPELSMKVVATK